MVNNKSGDDMSKSFETIDQQQVYLSKLGIEHAIARSAHEQVYQVRDLHYNEVDLYSQASVKTPVLVAAGGIAAVLGFYSANYTNLSINSQNLATFNLILVWLFTSLVFGMLAPCAGYFSQLYFAIARSPKAIRYSKPYIVWDDKKDRHNTIGRFFRWVCIIFVASSIVCIITAGWFFLTLI